MKTNRTLVIPSRLVVTTLAVVGACTPPPVQTRDVVDVQTVRDVQDEGDVGNERDVYDELVLQDTPDVPDVPCTVGRMECLPNWVMYPGATCRTDRVCSADQCGSMCAGCEPGIFSVTAGVACVRDPRSDAGNVACPGRVCEASHCPMGCVTCNTVLTCVSGGPNEAGVTPDCGNMQVCSPADCPAGCFAV